MPSLMAINPGLSFLVVITPILVTPVVAGPGVLEEKLLWKEEILLWREEEGILLWREEDTARREVGEYWRRFCWEWKEVLLGME